MDGSVIKLTLTKCVSLWSVLPVFCALRSPRDVMRTGIKHTGEGVLFCRADVVILGASFLGFLWRFGWSGLQTMSLETVAQVDCDPSCCCSSLGAVWGSHIRLDAQLAPSTWYWTCSLGKAQCGYRNNLHALWTDWKRAPVHSIGTGPDAENTQSSEGDTKQEESQLNDLPVII